MVNINKNPPWFRTAAKCRYSGLPVTQPDMFISQHPETNYFVDVAKLGDRIILVRAAGYARSFEMQEWKMFMDDFISMNFDIKTGIVYVEDYTDVKGADAEARKIYIDYYVYLRQRKVLMAAILCRQPFLFNISYNIARRLYPIEDVYNVTTHKQAIALALKLLDNNVNGTQASLNTAFSFPSFIGNISQKTSLLYQDLAKQLQKFSRSAALFPSLKIRRQNIETLLKYIESIDWHTEGVKNPEGKMFSDPLMKQAASAIAYIKSEVDGLLNEQKGAEKILRESEIRYRRLVEHARAGILEYNYETHRIVSVNDSFLDICGYSKAEIFARNPEELLSEESRKLFRDRMKIRMQGKNIAEDAVYEFFTKSGEKKWVMLTANVFHDKDRPRKADIIIIDITPIKSAETRLMEYQTRLKALSMQLARAEERQRRELASRLHESVSQELFVAQLKLENMKKSLAHPSQFQHLQEVNAQIVKSIKEIKTITYDLSPPVLYDLGLPEALESLSATVEARNGVKIAVKFNGTPGNCSDEIKHVLYRVVKEILQNIVKHARADQAGLSIEMSENDLFVDVTDNGIGFDTAPFSQNHYGGEGFGLFDIREKIQNLGGDFRICSTPGQGTRVSIAVPMSSE